MPVTSASLKHLYNARFASQPVVGEPLRTRRTFPLPYDLFSATVAAAASLRHARSSYLLATFPRRWMQAGAKATAIAQRGPTRRFGSVIVRTLRWSNDTTSWAHARCAAIKLIRFIQTSNLPVVRKNRTATRCGCDSANRLPSRVNGPRGLRSIFLLQIRLVQDGNGHLRDEIGECRGQGVAFRALSSLGYH